MFTHPSGWSYTCKCRVDSTCRSIYKQIKSSRWQQHVHSCHYTTLCNTSWRVNKSYKSQVHNYNRQSWFAVITIKIMHIIVVHISQLIQYNTVQCLYLWFITIMMEWHLLNLLFPKEQLLNQLHVRNVAVTAVPATTTRCQASDRKGLLRTCVWWLQSNL